MKCYYDHISLVLYGKDGSNSSLYGYIYHVIIDPWTNVFDICFQTHSITSCNKCSPQLYNFSVRCHFCFPVGLTNSPWSIYSGNCKLLSPGPLKNNKDFLNNIFLTKLLPCSLLGVTAKCTFILISLNLFVTYFSLLTQSIVIC